MSGSGGCGVTRSLLRSRARMCRRLPSLEQVLHGLSLHDILDPDGLSAAIGIPLLPLIEGVYEHYEEHTADLERLCAR